MTQGRYGYEIKDLGGSGGWMLLLHAGSFGKVLFFKKYVEALEVVEVLKLPTNNADKFGRRFKQGA